MIPSILQGGLSRYYNYNNYYYYSYFLRVFHISVSWWSFMGVWVTASLLVSRTLLSILADHNNAVVWIVSTRSLISKSFSPCINSLVIVKSAPIMNGKIFTFRFHVFFYSLARARYLPFFSLSSNFTLWSAGTAKTTNEQVFLFVCFCFLF